jgi:hypothetical protein
VLGLWQFDWDAVDHARDGALLPVEVQRAVLEVLHDPQGFLDLAAGRQPERATLESESGPRLVDRPGHGFRTAVG